MISIKRAAVAAMVVALAAVGIAQAEEETTSFGTVADTQIRQWDDASSENFGSATSLAVGDYPSRELETWGLLQWDLTSLPASTVITNASFEIAQTFWTLPANQMEIHGVASGDWDESTVTWDNWASTSLIEYLGSMEVVRGVCTFSDPALTAWVQDWIDGDQENLGLVMRYHSAPGSEARPGVAGDYDEYFGDFLTKEYVQANPGTDVLAPQLIITTDDEEEEPPVELEGDLNDDGFVGGSDLDIVRSNWGQYVPVGDLLQGDPSGDGFVGGDDLDLIRGNWGEGTLPAPASVPEPSTAIWLIWLGLWFAAARYRGAFSSSENAWL